MCRHIDLSYIFSVCADVVSRLRVICAFCQPFADCCTVRGCMVHLTAFKTETEKETEITPVQNNSLETETVQAHPSLSSLTFGLQHSSKNTTFDSSVSVIFYKAIRNTWYKIGTYPTNNLHSWIWLVMSCIDLKYNITYFVDDYFAITKHHLLRTV